MLQILSTSNETSTGPELVQNGDFSELGADLVTNGDFSAAGSNLVTNPNFTDTGSELVDNNDFSNGTTDWSADGGSTISVGTHEGRSDVADINITGTATNNRISHAFSWTEGSSYKVTCDVYVVSGSFRIDTADSLYAGDFVSTDVLGSWQTLTAYITSNTTGSQDFWLRSMLDGGVGEVSQFYVDSVSIKELGEDWASPDGNIDTYNENGVTITSINAGNDNRLLQSSVTEDGKSYKVIYTIHDTSYSSGTVFQYFDGDNYISFPEQGVGTHTFYFTRIGTNDFWYFNLNASSSGSLTDFVTISSLVVQELGEGWTLGTGWSIGSNTAISDGTNSAISQSFMTAEASYKISVKVTGNPTLLVFSSTSFYGDEAARTLKNGTHNYYLQAKVANFSITNEGGDACTITNISTEQLDPNDYWTLGTGWSIGADKAISTVTSLNSDITQSILTAGKTYRTVYEIVDYDAGTAQAIVTGSDGADAVALGTYTEDLTTTGTDFSIRSKLGTFDGAVSSVSVKQLGTYEDQSIYVTAADVQTLPQASVYYLVELTSMASKNSIYFLPSSVVPNNGRYTKLNFTVVSKDALPTPASGIISFYDSVGGFDTYPMGFYEFRIYEQTSSTNLDPTLATGLLEKGFAFVRDFSGNMQELTDGFKEYNPTLTQYVYSK